MVQLVGKVTHLQIPFSLFFTAFISPISPLLIFPSNFSHLTVYFEVFKTVFLPPSLSDLLFSLQSLSQYFDHFWRTFWEIRSAYYSRCMIVNHQHQIDQKFQRRKQELWNKRNNQLLNIFCCQNNGMAKGDISIVRSCVISH